MARRQSRRSSARKARRPRAVSRSVLVSPIITDRAGSAPIRLAVSVKWRGSGLRTGRVSAPRIAPKRCRPPRSSSRRNARRSGLLVQTPIRQPAASSRYRDTRRPPHRAGSRLPAHRNRPRATGVEAVGQEHLFSPVLGRVRRVARDRRIIARPPRPAKGLSATGSSRGKPSGCSTAFAAARDRRTCRPTSRPDRRLRRASVDSQAVPTGRLPIRRQRTETISDRWRVFFVIVNPGIRADMTG